MNKMDKITKNNSKRRRQAKNRAKPQNQQSPEFVLNVMSNAPDNKKYDLLQMFYQGTLANSLAYMDALNIETGQVEAILVGMAPGEDGKVDIFPLARILSQQDGLKYRAPDGKGGFAGVGN